MNAKTKKVMKKIVKLKAMAEGAKKIGSHAEAAAFAASVQKLCTAYNLSLEQVELERENEEGIDTAAWGADDFKTRKTWWEHELAVLIGVAHSCEVLMAKGTNLVWFLGRTMDRECAVWVYDILLKYVKDGVQSAYNEARRDGVRTKNFYTSFYRGFLSAIRLRYEEEARAHCVPDSQALAISKPEKGIEKWLEKEGMKDKPAIDGPKRPSARNLDGYYAGKTAGMDAPIRSRGLGDETGNDAKKLEQS